MCEHQAYLRREGFVLVELLGVLDRLVVNLREDVLQKAPGWTLVESGRRETGPLFLEKKRHR